MQVLNTPVSWEYFTSDKYFKNVQRINEEQKKKKTKISLF